MKRYIRSEALDKRPPKSEIDNYIKLDNGKYMLRDEWLALRNEYNDVQDKMSKFGVGSKSPKYMELAQRRQELREAMGLVDCAESHKGYVNRRPSRIKFKNNSSYQGKL